MIGVGGQEGTWLPHLRAPSSGRPIRPKMWATDLEDLADGLWPAVLAIVRRTAAELEDGVQTAASGGVVGVRSGYLLRSIRTETVVGSGIITSRLMLSERYRVHEFGATIVPRSAKMLRIPFPGGPAAFIDPFGGIQLRTVSRKFRIIKSRAGNLVLMDVATEKPWYLLRSRVTIPKRPIVEPSRHIAAVNLTQRLAALMGAA